MTEVLKRTWAEINLDALAFNYNQIRNTLKPNVKLCSVIKADAYGHGAVQIAQELQALGTDYFAVSNLEEALQIRLSGIQTPILILGYTPALHASTLSLYHITQCVYSHDYAVALSEKAAKEGVIVTVHLKIDTGMNRIGFHLTDSISEEEIEALSAICRLPSLNWEGIFTHFAVSDEGKNGEEFTRKQALRFQATVQALDTHGHHFTIRHCANSAAILDYPEMHFDMVRAGIIHYGLYPSSKLKNHQEFHPTLALKSTVSNVKMIDSGDTVSYGRVFTAEKAMKIITVPIGYADGYPRILSAKGAEVLVGGKRCKIVGRICMDQLMADASNLDEVTICDEVTLIGCDGNEKISADELANYQESINYEVICDIGKRVPRVYYKDGKIVSVINQVLPQTFNL
ncbi:alanine racemase [Scatolibacter rhodanostii]|uniref:alanine racemase n=1 Tax=Scatolibacter rhodanostii TaxID=2014781 RepID=UPI000C083FFE|nr:alanine racemase [Scatolibacter rhodanostii]